jgi:hypothetical protein
MAMKFDEFVADLKATMQKSDPHVAFDGAQASTHASWSLRERSVAVDLVPPLNVSVTLNGTQVPVTTWYPIDSALVPVVSRRITGYLSEA